MAADGAGEPVGVQVSFDFDAWLRRYPEFEDTVTQDLASEFFAEATLYHANDGSGPVRTVAAQSMLLNMVTAHVAQMAVGSDNNPPSSAVGRVSSATQGSISATLEMEVPPGTAQWWSQTKYGAAYWAATAAYRTARYLASRSGRTMRFPFFR